MQLEPDWEYVADTVMGGVSRGQLTHEIVAGRSAHRLTGDVSLENDGGFVQMAFDLQLDGGAFDVGAYAGIEVDLHGNDHGYDLRLRTTDLDRPWQSFRTEFHAPAQWVTRSFAFTDFTAHKTEETFDPAHLRRIGILGIGREFRADIAVCSIRLI